MNNDFTVGFEKSAGIRSWLGKVTGVSKYRAGKKGMKAVQSQVDKATHELSNLDKMVDRRKAVLHNRIMIIEKKNPKLKPIGEVVNDVPSELLNKQSYKKLDEEITDIYGYIKETKNHYAKPLSAHKSSSQLAGQGVGRMQLVGGTTLGLGLTAAHLNMKKKNEENDNNFKQAIS